jgi:hypothetical protein
MEIRNLPSSEANHMPAEQPPRRPLSVSLNGALSRENVGHVLTRDMTVTGDELTIRLDTATASGEPIVRTLRWRRVG